MPRMFRNLNVGSYSSADSVSTWNSLSELLSLSGSARPRVRHQSVDVAPRVCPAVAVERSRDGLRGFVRGGSESRCRARRREDSFRMPGQRQQERRVACPRRVDDDVVAEVPTIGVLRLRRLVVLRREDFLEVPHAVLVLHEVHVRMLDAARRM